MSKLKAASALPRVRYYISMLEVLISERDRYAVALLSDSKRRRYPEIFQQGHAINHKNN